MALWQAPRYGQRGPDYGVALLLGSRVHPAYALVQGAELVVRRPHGGIVAHDGGLLEVVDDVAPAPLDLAEDDLVHLVAVDDACQEARERKLLVEYALAARGARHDHGRACHREHPQVALLAEHAHRRLVKVAPSSRGEQLFNVLHERLEDAGGRPAAVPQRRGARLRAEQALQVAGQLAVRRG